MHPFAIVEDNSINRRINITLANACYQKKRLFEQKRRLSEVYEEGTLCRKWKSFKPYT